MLETETAKCGLFQELEKGNCFLMFFYIRFHFREKGDMPQCHLWMGEIFNDCITSKN